MLFSVLAVSAPGQAAPPSNTSKTRPPSVPAECATDISPKASAEEWFRQGQCEEQKGHLVLALDHYQASLRKLPARPFAQRVEARIAVVVPQLASLRVEVLAGTADARVKVDGRPMPTNTDRKMDPGIVKIDVEASGYQAQSQSIELATGESRTVKLALQPDRPIPSDATPVLVAPQAPAAPAPTPAPAPSTATVRVDSSLRSVGYVALVVGGVAVVGGSVTGILAMKSAKTVQRECPTTTTCSADGASVARSGEVFSTASTASFIGAGVFGILGATFILLAPSRTVRIAPSVGGLAVTVTGM